MHPTAETTAGPSPAAPVPGALPSARLSAESVHVVAQSLSHLPPLTDGAAGALAQDMEYRLRQIVQDAVKFMKHAKRSRLQPHDVNAALRLRNVEPLYGFAAPHTARPAPDAPALGAPPMLVPRPPPAIRQHGFATVRGTPDLFFACDTELNVRTVLEAPLPALPLEPTVCAHWLAIDSVQPRISQNPLKLDAPLKDAPRKDANAAPDGTDARLTSVQALASRAVVKPVVKHVLSRELQLYYESLTAIFFANDVGGVQTCLGSFGDDTGLIQLLPYFSAFISKTVRAENHNLPLLLSLMRLFSAILDNKAFPLERYLHQLLPSILTCLVGKRLCASPRNNHWALRDYTASIIQRICARFGPTYTKLQGRITRTLSEAIDAQNRPLTTHYGAIVGLAPLGPLVVEQVLIPRLSKYSRKVAAIIENKSLKPIRRMEASKVYGALAWALSLHDQKANGTANGFGTHMLASKALSPPLDEVSVLPQEVDRTLPNFEKLLPGLEKDLSKRLYPFGEGLSPADLAESIAAEVERKDTVS